MEDNDQVRQLLQEILAVQREHLAVHKRVTAQSLELQQRAVARQEQVSGLYRRVVLVGGILLVAVLGLLAFLLAR